MKTRHYLYHTFHREEFISRQEAEMIIRKHNPRTNASRLINDTPTGSSIDVGENFISVIGDPNDEQTN